MSQDLRYIMLDQLECLICTSGEILISTCKLNFLEWLAFWLVDITINPKVFNKIKLKLLNYFWYSVQKGQREKERERERLIRTLQQIYETCLLFLPVFSGRTKKVFPLAIRIWCVWLIKLWTMDVDRQPAKVVLVLHMQEISIAIEQHVTGITIMIATRAPNSQTWGSLESKTFNKVEVISSCRSILLHKQMSPCNFSFY